MRVLIFLLCSLAFSAGKTWVGGTSTSWKLAANWNPSGVPAAVDTAIFDANATRNCDIDSNANVNKIRIAADFADSVKQNSSITITVGAGGFDMAAGTFAGGNSTITINGDFTLSGGAFTATSGTLDIRGQSEVDNTGNFTVSGGTFTHNSGTVKFDHYPTNYSTDSAIIAINLPSSNQLEFGSLIFNNASTNSNVWSHQSYSLSSDTLIVTGTFTQTSNNPGNNHYTYLNSGVILAQGNVSFTALSYGGTASMVFTGSAASQTLTYAGSVMLSGAWKVDKTAGSVVLGSNITFPGKLRVTSGGFAQDSTFSLQTSDSLVINANGFYSNTGRGRLILGGPLFNDGTVFMKSFNTVCGDADSIFIRSSVNGTRRNWGGSGSFYITDVRIRDMSSTPAITAYSSTDSANNTTNWTISSACNPTVPVLINARPAASKRGSIITVSGDNFLANQGIGAIMIGTISLGAAQSWNDSVIVDTVPAGATFGSNNLIVKNSFTVADTIRFRVTNPSITIP